MIEQSRMSKHSPRSLAFGAVYFSCFGGIGLGWGIQQLIHTRGEYEWTASLLIGSAFVLWGIYWAVMLVRYVSTSEASSSSLHG